MGFGTILITGLGLIISLAFVSVVFGTNAQTTQVITATGNALTNVIGAAVKPVSSGGQTTFNNAVGAIGGING